MGMPVSPTLVHTSPTPLQSMLVLLLPHMVFHEAAIFEEAELIPQAPDNPNQLNVENQEKHM
jgi:hypothetical protein